jgi:hypothetical protein
MSVGNKSTTYLGGFKVGELKEEDIPMV